MTRLWARFEILSSRENRADATVERAPAFLPSGDGCRARHRHPFVLLIQPIKNVLTFVRSRYKKTNVRLWCKGWLTPKLRLQDVERNQVKIEDAALRVFTRLGFHGTSVRDIAKEAHVSIGNLYNYYRTKEEIYVSVITRYEAHMEKLRRKALGDIQNVFGQAELQRMAHVIREIVYDNPDYWRLMYIDITEFGNEHFAGTFRSLAKGMKARIGPQLEKSTRDGNWNSANRSRHWRSPRSICRSSLTFWSKSFSAGNSIWAFPTIVPSRS